MRNLSWLALAVGAIVLVAIFNSFYVVRQDEQALILQVGEPRAVINAPGTDEAGLYFKIPVISGQRAILMDSIREKVAAELADDGISIIDVRIRQADLPREVADGVYSRMQTARKQEAERIRAEGEERARWKRKKSASLLYALA